MNQIEKLCDVLSSELSAMRCPDCGRCHHVEVSHLKGETVFSPSFPTLCVGPEPDAFGCHRFMSKIRARITEARSALMKRNGLM